MQRELKVRIDDFREVEKKLAELGAKFIKEFTYKYTYFNQPEGKVLKITKREEGNFLVKLERRASNFNCLSNEHVSNLSKTMNKLSSKFGISKHIINKRRFFEYKEHLISTNQVKDIGQFLLIEGKSPSRTLAEEITGSKKLEIVRKPFDKL